MSACSLASAVIGRVELRPNVLPPSEKLCLLYSGREDGGGVETTRWPVLGRAEPGREDEAEEREERLELNGDDILPMNDPRRL